MSKCMECYALMQGVNDSLYYCRSCPNSQGVASYLEVDDDFEPIPVEGCPEEDED